MKRLTTEEKERIRTMLEQQNAEQHKKRRRYYAHKAILKRAAGAYKQSDVNRAAKGRLERLENLEKKHKKTEHQVAERSKLRAIHLTEREKKELEAKIRGVAQ